VKLNERPLSIVGEIEKDEIAPPVELIANPLIALAAVAFSVADVIVNAGALGALGTQVA
jgi:hypothetical protein